METRAHLTPVSRPPPILLLALVLTSIVVLAGLATFVALRDSQAVRAGIIAVDISRLSPGKAVTVEASLPGQPKGSRRVFG